jgi:MoxR-like ATPase
METMAGRTIAPTGTTPTTPSAPAAGPADVGQVAETADRIARSVGQVMAGREEAIRTALACVLSGGHLLIEDIPGVGKTLLAQALAASVGGSFHRIQGTPDLLPGDVTGTMVPHGDGFELRFRPGPMFSNIVVFDELNRANPRTQSALLEATEEAAVTVDGVTRELPSPFLLIATQNPVEMTGTYPLGEGALDRFAAVVSPGRAAARRRGRGAHRPPRVATCSRRSSRWSTSAISCTARRRSSRSTSPMRSRGTW